MIKPSFSTKKIESSENYGKFILTPLPAGYGHSMGNALRRVLLSSIEGVAVTYVKINNTVHPFSSIDGVKESALEIILNIKSLRFSFKGNGPFTMNLSHKGKGKVAGANFKGGDVEVVNKDQSIAELTTSDAKLEIEITIEKGMGFSAAEEKEEATFGTMAVDSVFSPVTKVVYKVEDERVGRTSNFDKLTLEIWTDGAISPEDSLAQSAEILTSFFGEISSENDEKASGHKAASSDGEGAVRITDEKVNEIIIDELDLPTRVINALLREKIETVGDLVTRGPEALANLKGVGRKSISLIEKEVEKFGVKIELK
jgi:DNA-directed RNA polymerase subunit alpha